MSRDYRLRYRYAVTFSVTLYVEAEAEDKAALYADDRMLDALDFPGVSYRLEDIQREDGA